VGGLLTRSTGRAIRRGAFGAVIGATAGVAIFLAVSHSGAASSGAKAPAAVSPSVTAASPAAPSSGKPATSASSSTTASNGFSSSKSGSAGDSAGHGQSTSGGAGATTSAQAATAFVGERAHDTTTTFSITADGSGTSDAIETGDTAVLAESGLQVGATGTVVFVSGSTTLCTATLPATSCSTSASLPAADYPATTGTYSGDGTFAGSISTNSLDIDVKSSPPTAVSDSADPTTYGQAAGFTATVDPTDGDGTVAFYADGSTTPIAGCSAQTLSQGGAASFRRFTGAIAHAIGGIAHVGGSVGSYVATCSTTLLGAGTHTIMAVYSGDPGFGASSGMLAGGQTVNPATLNILASSPTINFGDTPPAITPSYFGLQNSDTQTSTLPTCSSTYTSGSPVGSYPSTCTGAADPNYNITEDPGMVTVNPDPTSLSITVGGSPTNDTIDFGSTDTFAETGLPAGAAGTVTFSSGATTLCTATLPTTTSCQTDPSLPVGDYSGISGVFDDTDGNYADSTSSNTVDLMVVLTPTTTTVGSSANPSVFGSSVTLTATVSTTDGDGSVAFSADGNPIGGCSAQGLTPAASTEEATCQTSTLTVGNHPISAVYSGDSGFATSTGTLSGGQTVTLNTTSFTITVGGSPTSDTIDFGTTATLAESGLPGGATGNITYASGGTTLCTASLPSGTCHTSASLAVGDYPGISGTFVDTDGNFRGSTSSNTVDLTVDQVATTTTLASSVNPSSFGQSVTFTATVSPDDAGGSVAFSAAGTVISGCGAELLTAVSGNGKATCATTALSVATHVITAQYSGDTDYGSSGGTLSADQVVNKAATSFSITVNTSPTSASVPFGTTATLAETGLPAGADGSINFVSAGTTPLCSAELPATTCTTSASLAVGGYPNVAGTFVDSDGNYTGSTSSNDVTLTVTADPTTTTVVSSANPSVYGSSVTFTASVTATDGGGSVSFSAGGTVITGCGTEGLTSVSGTFEATCSTAALTAANHPISATYSGDSGFSGSSGTVSGGQVVTKAPTPFTITVNTSPTSATIDFGQTATLADASLPAGAAGTVTFSSGGTTLCAATLPATSCLTSASLAVGNYSSVAGTFADTDGNFAGSTSTNTVGLTVNLAPTTTAVSSGANPSVYGTSVTFTAAVSATDGGGTVAFSADSVLIGGCGAENLASVSGTFQATCSTSALSVGSRVITAVYSGDAGYATSNGTLAGGQTVNPPHLTITASNASISYGTTPPAVTASYSGFKNGDTFHSLTTQPTCTTTATDTSTVAGSPYVSSCSGAVDPNYSFVYVNGTVSVTRASTSFSSQLNGSSSPQTINFGSTAAVAETGLPAGATGTVTYVDGSTPICVITLPATSCLTSASLPIATYGDITGTFADTDGNYSGSASTNALSLTVQPVPGAPVAVADGYRTGVGQTLTVDAADGVLANDTLNGATIVGSTDPANGTLTLNADGSFTYIPNAQFAGDDTFSYTVQNGVGSSVALVTIDVSNAAPASTPMPSQVFGQTAIETSVAISQQGFPTGDSAGGVVLARSDFFADALAGGPLAAHVGGPLLLTPGAPISSNLDPSVQAEIARVLAPGGTVYILGGDLAISSHVDATLSGLGFHVVRLAGKDEYATAVDVAEQLGNPSTVFEATGLSFYDALSAVPAAIEDHGAILLTDGATQAPETAAYLAAHAGDARYAIGGPLAAYGADPHATPVYGQDQFGTSAAIASRFFPNAVTFGAATASDFQDALGGGVFMGTLGHAGPMLLVNSAAPLPTAIAQYLGTLQKGAVGYVFGGPDAIGSAVISALQSAAG
jgi:large repetitive protein